MTSQKLSDNVLKPNRVRLIHYHLFKNAGTSLDSILQDNFGVTWQNHEFTQPRAEIAKSTKLWMETNKNVTVLSSHTALGPCPEIKGEYIIPLIFIRHPIDRLMSAYKFEKNQKADTFGAQLAKNTNFQGYIKTLLEKPNHLAVRNFQSDRLYRFCRDPQLDRAGRLAYAIEHLPFIGLVEQFDNSVEKLKTLLKPIWPTFKIEAVQKNISQSKNQSLEEKIEYIRSKLDEDTYAQLIESNREDIHLYAAIKNKYMI